MTKELWIVLLGDPICSLVKCFCYYPSNASVVGKHKMLYLSPEVSQLFSMELVHATCIHKVESKDKISGSFHNVFHFCQKTYTRVTNIMDSGL